MWQTPVGSGPKDLVSRDDDNILRDVTRRGRDAARENPSFVIQVELANKIHNPTVREHAASLRAVVCAVVARSPLARRGAVAGGARWARARRAGGGAYEP